MPIRCLTVVVYGETGWGWCPENWAVTLPQQQGQFVTIAPEAGVTNNGVGYGVLLNGAPASRAQRMSIDDMTGQVIRRLQQSS